MYVNKDKNYPNQDKRGMQITEPISENEFEHDLNPVKKSRGRSGQYQREWNTDVVPPSEHQTKQKIFSNLIGKRRFIYADVPEFHFKSKRILYITLGLYLLEYLLILAFQIPSYLKLHDTFHNTSWGIGLALLIAYLIIAPVLMFLVSYHLWIAAFIVKFFEFAIHFVLLGWAVAYLEFALMSLSYMMIANILVLFIFVF